MTRPEAVADAGPLIHLDEVGMGDALHAYRRIVVPHAIADEVRAQPRGPGTRLLRERHVHLTRPSAEEVAVADEPLGRRLGPADRVALAMARSRECDLLTDDLDLRDAARLVEVQPVGTVGLIVLGALTGRLPRAAASQALDDLWGTSSLFITKALVDEARGALEG